MIYHLAVKEDLRKQGIAAQLMDELENRLQAKGCIRSYLLVTSDNFEAIRFYEAHNWKRMELLTYGKDLG
jgi:ribosomal protein S18 acetylase RimI-like enzyme